MKKIELREEQLNNLLIFLERVDLKGQEAIAYVGIVQSLVQAQMAQEDLEETG